MKVFKNLSITALAMLLTLPVISMHHEEGAKDPMMKNMMTAKKWIEAGQIISFKEYISPLLDKFP